MQGSCRILIITAYLSTHFPPESIQYKNTILPIQESQCADRKMFWSSYLYNGLSALVILYLCFESDPWSFLVWGPVVMTLPYTITVLAKGRDLLASHGYGWLGDKTYSGVFWLTWSYLIYRKIKRTELTPHTFLATNKSCSLPSPGSLVKNVAFINTSIIARKVFRDVFW